MMRALGLVVIFMPGMGIRQCGEDDRWLITIEHKHAAIERRFGEAMRSAKTFACATFRYLNLEPVPKLVGIVHLDGLTTI